MSNSINLDGGRVELIPVFADDMGSALTLAGYRLNVIQKPGALMSPGDLTQIADLLTEAVKPDDTVG